MSLKQQREHIPVVSVVVLSWNSKNETRACLLSILQQDQGVPYELIVIENGSEDGSVEMIQSLITSSQFPHARVVFNQKNLGFAGGVNQAARFTKGKYMLLLNSDTVVPKQVLSIMATFLDAHPAYGAVTTKLLNLDGSTQYFHRRFLKAHLVPLIILSKRKPFHWLRPFLKAYLYQDKTYETDFDVEQPAGANLMIRSEDVRGDVFDADQFPLFFNDVDLATRIWKSGKRIRCLTKIAIVHHKGLSIKKMGIFGTAPEYTRSALLYFKKHGHPAQAVFLRIFFLCVYLPLTLPTPLLLLLKRINKEEAKKRLAVLRVLFHPVTAVPRIR